MPPTSLALPWRRPSDGATASFLLLVPVLGQLDGDSPALDGDSHFPSSRIRVVSDPEGLSWIRQEGPKEGGKAALPFAVASLPWAL